MSNIVRPGGTVIYFRDNGTNVLYSIDAVSWNAVTFPCTITNSNTSAGVLRIEFTTAIIMRNVSDYFICGSSHIQVGSTSLLEQGLRASVTIQGVTNYPGLIRNGTGSVAGYSNIYIYNIQVVASSTTLADGAGWIGHEYFGKAALGNYIVNCYSDGDISDYGGGIVGQASGGSLVGQTAILGIRGCSSTGSIGQYAGGIAGHAAGEGNNVTPGSITCASCWSEGFIGQNSGGIFGTNAGVNFGAAVALNCYSTGYINTNSGGIFGPNAGDSFGYAQAQACYSRGNIGTDGGGIFGKEAASGFGSAGAVNCYSVGTQITPNTGIFGSNKQSGAAEINCYAANGTWVSTTANSQLQETPNPTVGITWIARGINQPYELRVMGYSPYTLQNINASSELVRSFSQTVQAGQAAIAAIQADASGNQFVILKTENGDPASYDSILMNSQTGVISTTSNTVPGIYLITLRSVGSYNITQFELTITEPGTSCCEKPLYISRDVDYAMRNDLLAGNTLIGNTSVRRGPISYTDIMNMKRAYAAKR